MAYGSESALLTCRLSSLRHWSSVWCLRCWFCRSRSACCASARSASICSTRTRLSLLSTSSSLCGPSVWGETIKGGEKKKRIIIKLLWFLHKFKLSQQLQTRWITNWMMGITDLTCARSLSIFSTSSWINLLLSSLSFLLCSSTWLYSCWDWVMKGNYIS